jgi:nucleotide-binding universal stress UspA family protein
MNDFAKSHRLKDFTIHIFNDMTVAAGITNFTDLIDGDLIALGLPGGKGIAHLLRGSTTKDVINHVKYPMWTYTVK